MYILRRRQDLALAFALCFRRAQVLNAWRRMVRRTAGVFEHLSRLIGTWEGGRIGGLERRALVSTESNK